MKSLRRFFLYLVDPRSTNSLLPEPKDEVPARRIPWKGVLNLPFALGTFLVLVVVAVVWFGPGLASYDPYITTRSVPTRYDAEQKILIRPPFEPSLEYPLGTDRYGNDILSLILYGARVTILTSLAITASRLGLGLVLGGAAGWFSNSGFDHLLGRLIAVITSVPLLLSTMLLILSLDITRGSWIFIFALSVLGWTETAQLVRSEIIRVKNMLYIVAAEALGLTRFQIMVRHALPNILSYLISIFFLEMGAVLLLMAELGYLGLFVGGGTRFREDEFSPIIILREIPEWGALVAQGTPYLRSYPHMVLGPSAAFFLVILGLNAFGEGLRRIFNRWPFSTAFLLRKEMLVVLGAFCALTGFIFQRSNADMSYQRAAAEFKAHEAAYLSEVLAIYSEIPGPEGGSPLMDLIVEDIKSLDVQPGWTENINRYHYYPVSTALARPLSEPRLQVGSRDRYHYQNEFAFLTEGFAGAGFGEGPVFYMAGGCAENCARLMREEGRGKIILIPTEEIDERCYQEAARQGVEGILLVSQEKPPLVSQFEISASDPPGTSGTAEIPVFRITEAAARGIAAEAGYDWKDLSGEQVEESFLLDLALPGLLDLRLYYARDIQIPNMIGFLGGYDMDHADEIIVVYTSFDGLGLGAVGRERVPEDDLKRLSALLEIIHSWHAVQVDPRRSVLFVFWGGEGLSEPFQEMIYGLFETNRLVARVPTNIIPYLNTNPVKPAYWIEVGDLEGRSDRLTYAASETPYLENILKRAQGQNKVKLIEIPYPAGIFESGLPGLYFEEDPTPADQPSPDPLSLEQTGVLLNRLLIQLVRDVNR